MIAGSAVAAPRSHERVAVIDLGPGDGAIRQKLAADLKRIADAKTPKALASLDLQIHQLDYFFDPFALFLHFCAARQP